MVLMYNVPKAQNDSPPHMLGPDLAASAGNQKPYKITIYSERGNQGGHLIKVVVGKKPGIVRLMLSFERRFFICLCADRRRTQAELTRNVEGGRQNGMLVILYCTCPLGLSKNRRDKRETEEEKFKVCNCRGLIPTSSLVV